MLLQQHQGPALIWNDQRISYPELLARIDAVSRLFPAAPCDQVAIFSENRLEWVYAFYAGLKRGCTLVPIDFMNSAEDVAYILRDCAPSLVFCSNSTREVLAIKGACRALPSGSWLPRISAPISVSFLPAVLPGERSYEDLNQAVMEQVVAAVDGSGS
ncbi:MAG: AMP-binding protein [Lamprobacter sp.]|uniref:AMP-binding protein n=1 Tax=Lamprobacter sp. TaxID=3100796 RepID=UPI002B263972|nr:AMP-binding protein [Lamprobacter sp.]MEA3640171.1 AMP-binding protein [Lamprobacter sp.]